MKLVLALLLAGVIASGVGVVYARHQSRALFVQLQSLLSERDALNIEWGQLQLEQSTLATHGRIERLATERLDMHVPAHDEIILVKP